MSHFGRSGPPDISDTYSLLILNITFRTTPDDLYPLFSKYGKVVDIFIPRDRRTGDSKGFAFVRYKRADEAQKAIERLDGRNVDGREIVVQFAKYGPNAELIRKGRVSQESFKQKLSGSRSPRRLGRRDDYNRERDYRQRGDDHYRGRDYRRVSRSPDRYGRRRDRERDERRPRSRSASRSYSRSRSRSRSRSPDYSRRRKRSRGMSKSPETKEKGSPHAKRSHRSPSLNSHPSSSPSPRKRPLDRRGNSPVKSASPDDRQKQKRSPSPSRDSRSPPSGNTDNEV